MGEITKEELEKAKKEEEAKKGKPIPLDPERFTR